MPVSGGGRVMPTMDHSHVGWYMPRIILQYILQTGIGRYRYQTYVAVVHSGYRPEKKEQPRYQHV
eukprot:scaffold86595_cov61-Attheya_sp.AAC.1